MVDEVQSGMGRTGVPFHAKAIGLCPDLVSVGKALGGASGGYTVNEVPQPQVLFAFGLRIVKPPPDMLSTKSTSAPFRYRALIGSTNSLTPCDSYTWSLAP